MVSQDNDNALMFADMLDEQLDMLSEEDAFGTEGQIDPRGDQRNGEWSMYNVEGID